MTTPPRRLEGRRILLVDDDQDILAGMDLAFRGEGATTCLASDGAAALAMLDEAVAADRTSSCAG